MAKKIELGQPVRCKITGYGGIAVGRVMWIHGCDRIAVQGPLDKDGKQADAIYFDELQLEVVGSVEGVNTFKTTTQVEPLGGPTSNPPSRAIPIPK